MWCKVRELPIVIHNKIENHIHLVTRSFRASEAMISLCLFVCFWMEMACSREQNCR